MLPGAVLVSALPASSKGTLRFLQEIAGCKAAATLRLDGVELDRSVGWKFL